MLFFLDSYINRLKISSVPSGILGAPLHNMHGSMSGSTGHLNKRHANHDSSTPNLASNLSEVSTVNLAEFNEKVNLHDSQKSLQKSLHLLLKPEIAKLCEILQLPVYIHFSTKEVKLLYILLSSRASILHSACQ